MTKWMGLERWVGREMMRRLRFVVREPEWVKETRCKRAFPIDNKEQYLRVLRLWSGQRAKGIKKLESDKDKAFPPPAAYLLLRDPENPRPAPLSYNNGILRRD